MIDKRPALIARSSGVADVVDAVNLAREKTLPLAVRCGGPAHAIAWDASGSATLAVAVAVLAGGS